MLILNISAIGITNMTGSFGYFHIFVLISLPTILAAAYFPIFARSKQNWMLRHFEFMFWGYVGLIAAFVAEVVIRFPAVLVIPNDQVQEFSASPGSFVLAAAITGGIMFVAEILFRRHRKRIFG